METVDKTKLLNHIDGKIKEYRKRRDIVKSESDLQKATDYMLRVMVLDNLRIRIIRGDFDVKSE